MKAWISSRPAWLLQGIFVSAGILAAPTALAATAYTLTDLGVLPGYYKSYGFDVNDSGQVAGGSSTGAGFSRVSLYDGGVLTDLGSPYYANNIIARGINNNGDVVGFLGSTALVAALWKHDGTKTVLGTLPGGTVSGAWAINDSGQIAGYSSTSGAGVVRAFRYENGAFTALGTLGGAESWAVGINGGGAMAGYAELTGNTVTHAVVYDSNNVVHDLGTLGGTNSYATDINDLGQVAGDSQIMGSADRHAFFYDGSVMTEIGTLGGANSYSYGINNAGVVVGQSQITGSAIWHAFVYSGGVLSDLNSLVAPDPDWVLNYAYGINELGQITGMGTFNGVDRAFLLTPVPEPEAYLMMLVGLGLVGLMARRRLA